MNRGSEVTTEERLERKYLIKTLLDYVDSTKMKKHTHLATNRKTGKVEKVVHNQMTGKYEINWAIQLIEKDWDIKPLTLGM